MRKLLDSAVRWLRHPRLTLASNLGFVIGTGIFVAGLVGGGLKVLTAFPTLWLSLSVAGAFLVSTAGVSTLIRTKMGGTSALSVPTATDDPQHEQRQAVGRVLAELEVAKGAIERAIVESEWWIEPLPTDAWKTSADTLAAAGLTDAHKAARIAYRHVDDLNSRAAETYEAMKAYYEYDVPPGRRPATGGGSIDAVLQRAIGAIQAAEAELEGVQEV